MVFDKTKAMRNAERYLAQGKIQSAIVEYRQVVAHDQKDFGTLNMLGDLFTKASETKQAIKCYTTVAEHYSKQGFAQKAIAVYNKISKLEPGSIDVIQKLAELYKQKGSINEARTHYKTVAEHYEKLGRKLDALEIRKHIASLDPNDTSIYLNLAAAYLEEDKHDDAADAFTEAGIRFAKKSSHAEAIDAFEKALEKNPDAEKLLAAYVQSHFALGTPSVAAEKLGQLHEANPHDRDIVQLMIDCRLEAGETAEAEKLIVGLVEKEPTSHPKLLDLARIYLKHSDAESTARMMAMALEHLLLAGQVDEFQVLLDELLLLDPEQLEGLRLRARLAAWQRDEAAMQSTLVKLATIARERESVDDERFALSQLVMIAPQLTEYGDRLREINAQHGFDDEYSGDGLFDSQFMRASKKEAPVEPDLETFAIVTNGENADVAIVEETGVEELSHADFAIVATTAGTIASATPGNVDGASVDETRVGGEGERERLLREVDSIRFYIDSGYLELASKAIGEMRDEFGDRSEVSELVRYLNSHQSGETTATDAGAEKRSTPAMSDPVVSGSNGGPRQGFGINDLRSELGIDESETTDDSDYDTHYHTAVAYQEMGLLDEAIREFQEAVGLVQPNDPTRRFFQCANLLGHCFMQKSMPNLALTWYQRALETPGLSDEEKQGIWYELATAYEAEGDTENAGRYFEQVYAENINFRDVSERIRNMTVSQ